MVRGMMDRISRSFQRVPLMVLAAVSLLVAGCASGPSSSPTRSERKRQAVATHEQWLSDTRLRLVQESELRQAAELNLMEDVLGPATVAKGRLRFALRPFEIKTFGLQFARPVG